MAALTAALSSGAVTAAEGACLFSLPTRLTKRPRYLFVSFSPKSIRYSLRKFSPVPPLVTARASDWMAQQATTEEEREAEDGVSDWGDGQGDDGEEVEDDVADFVAAWGAGRGGEDEESYPEPQQESRLYVGNLPYDFDSDGLADLFEQAGVVEIAEVIYNRNAAQSRGFGFVTMRTVEEAEEAVKKFHRYNLNGRLLTVNIAAPRGASPQSPPGRSFKIFVSNLPWLVDEADLERLFSEHGKVLEARVVRDKATGRSRGFGFVTMSSEAELEDAIAARDGYSWEGRSLMVSLAVDKPRPKRF